MLKKILAICFVIMAFPVWAQKPLNAPELPKKVQGMPSILRSNHLYRDDLEKTFHPGTNWGTDKTEKQYWNVWSDRDNNITYCEPRRDAKICARLPLNGEFRIAKVIGDWALIYKENGKTPSFPYIENGVSYGYVEMSHLLMWKKCPADKRGVYYKAIISRNLNYNQDNYKDEYYRDPESNDNPTPLPTNMEYYFIFKEEGERVLLYKNPDRDANNHLGWVHKNAYKEWNQRTCLEPKWEPAYVEQQKFKGGDAAVYLTEDCTSSFTRWPFGTENGSEVIREKYRMPAAMLRFPILKPINDDSRSVECTVFATKDGSLDGSAQIADDAISNWESVNKGKTQLNIIFVVEATTEMQSYFPSLLEALNDMRSSIPQAKTLRVGAVAYQGVNAGNRRTYYVPLRDLDNTEIKTILSASTATGTTSGANADMALIDALNIAADANTMGFNEKQCNLIVIVGNRGPAQDDSDESYSSLQRLFTKGNVNLMAIQVNRKANGSPYRFNDYVFNLISNNVDAFYTNINHGSTNSDLPGSTGFDFRSTEGKSFLFSQIIWNGADWYKPTTKSMTPETFKKHLISGLKGFANIAKTQTTELNNAAKGFEYDEAWLKTQLGGDRAYEQWKEYMSIWAFTGYAKLKNSDQSNPWHYILFVDRAEYEKLTEDLRPLREAIRTGEAKKSRKKYTDALKKIVSKMIDTQIKPEDMTEEELAETIYGLNVKTEQMRKYTIPYILNKMTDSEYADMLKEFANRYDTFKNQGNYKFKIKAGQSTYYWFPLEMVP